MIYTELVMIVMGISLVLYTLLGGADFGAGIIELFIGDKANSTVSRAMAPVWEANHMWLIIAVVILFNGFPKAYTVLSTNLHIPVLLFLVAIILRGTAFTFRHYDAYQDGSQKLYSYIFRFSSIMAVFFLGVTVSAFFSGTIPIDMSGGFAHLYIFPWLNYFNLFVGVFMVVLSAYIGAAFLLGEVKTTAEYRTLEKFCVFLFLATVVLGLFVFLIAYNDNLVFFNLFLSNPFSITFVVIATLLIPLVFWLIKKKQIWGLRFMVGIQIVLILAGWFVIQWPNLVFYADGSVLSMYDAAGPEITMKILFVALAVGVVVIFPGLWYLFRVFKGN
ncbi:MAG: cytochrome d ubiquinol oxidase subunit II [Bacteroidota bacterium]